MALLRGLVNDVVRAAPKVVAANSEFGGRSPLDFFRSQTGRTIDHNNALGFSALYRATVLLATTIGAFPRHIYIDGQRTSIRLPDDAVIWGQPNPETLPIVFWEALVGHEILYGNAYIYVVRAGSRVREMYPVEPWRVKVGRDRDNNKIYEIQGADGTVVGARDFAAGGEIIHIPGYGYNGTQGLGVVQLAKTSIGIALAADEYAARYYPNSSVPSGGYLTSDQALTPQQAQELSEMWEQFHRGLSNAHRVAVLGRGTEYKTVMMNPEDLQLLETRKYQVREVATWLGIPPHLLGDVERSTSWGTGIEEQVRGFLTFTLDQHVVRFEQALNYSVLKDTGRYLLFERDALLRVDILKRYQAHALAINAGFMTRNEARALEELEPIDGLDEILVPLNMGGTSPE